MAPIERITLFKIPNEEDLNRVLEQYKTLAKTAVKVLLPSLLLFILLLESNNSDILQDGKPYILSSAVGKSFPDPRNKGFNLSVKTTFASLDDMKYYDSECEAHKALKAVAGPVREDFLMTYFESVL